MVAPLLFWKKAPFLRLVIPLISGILCEWYLPCPIGQLYFFGSLAVISLSIFFLLPFFTRYKFGQLYGIASFLAFACLGAVLTFHADIRNSPTWFGHNFKDSLTFTATITEPPIVKPNSFKAIAMVNSLIEGEESIKTEGKLIVYFSKDSTNAPPAYGTQIIFQKSPEDIRSNGNPGAFDMRRYCLFQGITHQVFLSSNQYVLVKAHQGNWLSAFIYSFKERILSILRKYINNKKELGLAEALLIGYKDDLDKTLVQSYSNTGVVHIIAISGLHLGLIYWILVLLFKPIAKRKRIRFLGPVSIIAGLWLFSLLAGAQPSVLRSALMFSCIVLGETLVRKTTMLNSLSLSAFLLLCYNPYWLWDVGFQLSYAAVLSIVCFMQPIYNLLYFKSKIKDTIWKLNAVTLSAQILTVPLCIFHFHQFPNYFLLTNLIAVPLSSAILIGEILLCLLFFIPWLASVMGIALFYLIRIMNFVIERTESFPFSVWTGLSINVAQVLVLYILIFTTYRSLKFGTSMATNAALACALGFSTLRAHSFQIARKQQLLIVYDIPRKSAIDLIDGRDCRFIGDPDLQTNPLRDFYLGPSRIAYRIENIISDSVQKSFTTAKGTHILIMNKSISLLKSERKPVVDFLILSGNPGIYLKPLAASLDIKNIVIDSSVPAWRSAYWKKDCDSLGIPYYDVAVKGAFAINLR